MIVLTYSFLILFVRFILSETLMMISLIEKNTKIHYYQIIARLIAIYIPTLIIFTL